MPDPGIRDVHEVDVVAMDGKRVRVLGEAKWGLKPSASAVRRLQHIRDLLGTRGFDVKECRLALFSGSGGLRGLGRAVKEPIMMVDLERLYEGD